MSVAKPRGATKNKMGITNIWEKIVNSKHTDRERKYRNETKLNEK